MKKIILLLSIFIILLSTSVLAVGLNISLSDQGSGVTYKTNGSSVSGDLTVSIWDAIIGGTNLYNETFTGGIVNGSWNVMLGENSSNNLSLEYGKMYYKDYTIALEDADFTMYNGSTAERQFFYSPLGNIEESDISTTTNLTLGGKITFTFGEIIDNLVDGIIQITGNLLVTGDMNVTNNLTVTDTIHSLDKMGIGYGTDNPEETLEVNGTFYVKNTDASKAIILNPGTQKFEFEEDMNISFEDSAGTQFMFFDNNLNGVKIDNFFVNDVSGVGIPACAGSIIGQLVLNTTDSNFYGCTGSSWVQLNN
jgi:hypothetical protein